MFTVHFGTEKKGLIDEVTYNTAEDAAKWARSAWFKGAMVGTFDEDGEMIIFEDDDHINAYYNQ